MNIEPGRMIPLGYGKYFRSDRIVGLEPIEEGRGPGQRTKVYLEQLATPIIASRSEGAILSDMVELPREITKIREQRELLSDLLDTISEINPFLRSIIRDQGKWDLDRLEERIRDVLRDDDPTGTKRVTASFTLARNDAGSARLDHLEEEQLWCGRPMGRLTSGCSCAIHHD